MVLLLRAGLCCRRQNRSHGDDHAEEEKAQEEESASGFDEEAEEIPEEGEQEGVAAAAPQQLEYMPPASKRSKIDAAQPPAAALPANDAPLQKHAGPDSAGQMLQQAYDQTGSFQELQRVQSVGQQQRTHVSSSTSSSELAPSSNSSPDLAPFSSSMPILLHLLLQTLGMQCLSSELNKSWQQQQRRPHTSGASGLATNAPGMYVAQSAQARHSQPVQSVPPACQQPQAAAGVSQE